MRHPKVRLLKSSFLFVFLLISSLLFAQARKVEGFVKDSVGAPVDGVSVTVKGTRTGTITDGKGYFSIMANDGSVLIFSSTGFGTKEQVVGAANVLMNVSLSGATQTMDAVVVVG